MLFVPDYAYEINAFIIYALLVVLDCNVPNPETNNQLEVVVFRELEEGS